MTPAATRFLPVAAILAAGAVAAVWYAGEGVRTAPPAAVPAPALPVAPLPGRTAAEAPRPVPEAAPAREAPPAVPREATSEGPRSAERAPATREAPTPRRAEASRYDPPRFDVVRVGLRGNAVVAGRASPGAEVMLFDGVREIGRARADSRGEWVILPADPVGSGAREFSLRARMPGGEEVVGADTVLVIGPAAVAEAGAGGTSSGSPTSQDGAPSGAGSGGTMPQVAASQPAPATTETRSRTGGPPGITTEARPDPAQRYGEAAQAPAPPQPATAEAPAVLLLPPTAQGAARPLSPRAGPQAFVLGLDVVDYDDSNTMRFAGSAPPGAQIRVYADDRHLGDARADAAGRWTLAPDPAPAVGRHTLRVDQLASAAPVGTAAPPVASRIEVPFQREALPAAFVRDGRVVVQPGNNLWRIAREAYGRGTRYTVIYRANQAQIRNPSRIYPGQVFAVPAVAEEGVR